MKLIKHGPTGALTISAGPTLEGVRLKFSLFIPTDRALTMLACFCGKGRNRLKNRDGRLVPAIERRLEPIAQGRDAVAVSDRLPWRWPALTQWQTEIAIPENHLKRMEYLTVYLGDSPAEAQEKWYSQPETIVLEVAKADWGSAESSGHAHFALMTRGDATQRLNHLYQTERILQSHQEEVCDALFDIFFLLVGGRDIQLMTCDLEGLTNVE